MPRKACNLNNSKYFKYKMTFNDSTQVKYFTTKKYIIKEYPKLTERIIYKYVCTDNKENFVPRERRRKDRGFWIERCKILIIRDNVKTIRIPTTAN